MHRYLVLLASTMACVTSVGYFFGTSRLLPVLIETFKTTTTEISIVPASFGAVINLIGLVSGVLVQRFGPRIVGAISSLIIGVSISVCFFARSVVHLVVCQGVITASATTCLYISCNVAVSNCFKGRGETMALSIVSCGIGTGGMLYSYILELLSSTYGVAGTYLTTGAISMNAFACALTWPTEREHLGTAVKPDTQTTPISERQKYNLKGRMKQLLSVKSFVLFAFGMLLMIVSSYTLLGYLADTLEDRGEEHLASLAVFLFNLCSLFGRILPGLLQQSRYFSVLTIPSLAVWPGVIGCLLIAFADRVALSLIGSVLGGFGFGILTTCRAVTSVKLVGKENLSTAMGFIFTITGLAALSSGPINGYMRDATGSYTMVYICAAVTSAVGGGFFLAANCATKCTRPQPREELERNDGIQIALSTFNNSSKEEVHQ